MPFESTVYGGSQFALGGRRSSAGNVACGGGGVTGGRAFTTGRTFGAAGDVLASRASVFGAGRGASAMATVATGVHGVVAAVLVSGGSFEAPADTPLGDPGRGVLDASLHPTPDAAKSRSPRPTAAARRLGPHALSVLTSVSAAPPAAGGASGRRIGGLAGAWAATSFQMAGA
jgi:hypothetical protein